MITRKLCINVNFPFLMPLAVLQENVLAWRKGTVEIPGQRQLDQQLALECQEGSFYPQNSDDASVPVLGDSG